MVHVRSLETHRQEREESPAARLDYLLAALRQAGLNEFARSTELQRRERRIPEAELVHRCEEYAAVAGLKYLFGKGKRH